MYYQSITMNPVCILTKQFKYINKNTSIDKTEPIIPLY